ncbi:MAG: DUF3857 domain-containing protein [Candidatus Zixiibacteriota bacterium]
MFFGAAVISAQEWGVISDAERQVGTPLEFPDADAVVIYDRGRVTAELRGLIYERHTRIKVLETSGVEKVKDVKIEAYDYDHIYGIKARVEKSDGRTFEFDDKQFEKISRGSIVERRFTFPNLEPGDILEYAYGIEYYGGLEKLGPEKYFLFSQEKYYGAYESRKKGIYPDDEDLEKNVSNVPSWYFDHPVFCLSSVFVLKLGSELDYTYFTANIPNERIDPEMERIKFITATVYKQYTWTMENIPPPPMDSSRTLDNEVIRAGLHFQLFSTIGQNRALRGIYTDEHWQHLGESFQGYLNEYMKKTKKMHKKVSELVKDQPDARSKATAIYDYISQNYTLDSTGFVLRPRHSNVDKLFKDGSGMPFEINILLVQMLRMAGFESWPVLINTTNKLPFRRSATFNHMLALVDIDGERVFLDATAGRCPMGMLAPMSMTNEGLLVDYSDSKPVAIKAEVCKSAPPLD